MQACAELLKQLPTHNFNSQTILEIVSYANVEKRLSSFSQFQKPETRTVLVHSILVYTRKR